MTLPTYLSVVEREIERLTVVGPYSNAVLKYIALLGAEAMAKHLTVKMTHDEDMEICLALAAQLYDESLQPNR